MSSIGDLHDKTALVTGASQGIGRGIAIELARAGAEVFVTHLPMVADVEKAQSVIEEIRSLGRKAARIPLDVTDKASISLCVSALFSRSSRLDILVNNAGVMQRGAGLETTADDFDRCYAVNLKGPWDILKALISHAQGASIGKIVNISSTAGRRGTLKLPGYCASKAAVISLTQSLAAVLGPRGVNVNAVCPGIVWTPMCEQFARIVDARTERCSTDMPSFLEAFREMSPLRRIPTVEDIGHAVVFLCSERARNITGQALNVDGGYIMS